MPSEIMDAQAVAGHPMDDDHDDDDMDAAVAVAADAAEEEDDDDEEEEVMAAVVEVADHDDEAAAEAFPVVAVAAAAEKKKTKRPKAVAATPTKAAGAASFKTGGAAASSTKKKPKKLTLAASTSSSLHISPLYLEAASDARAMLQETVPSLPMPIADITVRSFGRLLVDSSSPQNNSCTTAALYPIGFTCDRLEFSPVHGRLLKLRCSILDGRKLLQPNKIQGPVFRVMWGPGVDDNDDESSADHPFDPFVHAPPLSATPLALADYNTTTVSSSGSNNAKAPSSISPEAGMRVKVRLERSQYANGTIIAAAATDATNGTTTAEPKKKTKRKTPVHLTIRYDEGFTEETVYPDPDVELLLPGDDTLDATGNPLLTQIRGKPVTCVVDASPLEAWGKALIQLGLIDEIMCDDALASVKQLREDALRKARDKFQQNGQGSHTKASRSERAGSNDFDGSSTAVSSRNASPTPSSRQNGDGTPDEKIRDDDATSSVADEDYEPPSERELHLRQRVDELKEDLDEMTEENQHAALALADARIRVLGPFLCNPFKLDDNSKSQQTTWMAIAIKKEKMRMGSTGNKKKIVSALDLLERNDTFYNPDIEALVEGLPGSEYCDSYVFQAFRAAGCGFLNKSWVHDAQLKREKEAILKLKRSQEAQEKVQLEEERVKKRKHRDDVRDQRKRQKLEEEDQKKRARADVRLMRLRVQVEERLFNEANFQREKVIASIMRGLVREFARRRRAAELVAGHSIIEQARSSQATSVESQSAAAGVALPLLLSTAYGEDTLRVWDFMASFGKFFLERNFIADLPSLNSLQRAVESLSPSQQPGSAMLHSAAVSLLTELAVALCQPLAASLTRTLFASLIALNPNLQKDFGAAFFNEVSAVTPTKSTDRFERDDGSLSTDILLPVNVMTWQEIARASLLSDALGELGLQKHEAAHILRGYRSAGHPNSKEARRLRKIDDLWVSLVRQQMESGSGRLKQVKVPVRVDIPCAPLCPADSFLYFMHRISASAEPSAFFIKANILKSLHALKEDREDAQPKLQNILRLLDQANTMKEPELLAKQAKKEVTSLLKGLALPVLDISAAQLDKDESGASSNGMHRRLLGLLNGLSLSKPQFRQLVHERTLYMENALKLKLELKRKESNGEGDDDDEDDDEEDEVMQSDKSSHAQATKDAVAAAENINDSSDGDIKTASTNNSPVETSVGSSKIGKHTEYDDFCGDIPLAPELLRRCLAVLRSLCVTSQAASFLFPVDPQSNPGYYDAVIRPMCLRTIGLQLRHAAEEVLALDELSRTAFVEKTVTEFGRNVRLLEQNTLSYANAGPTVVAMAAELLRLFERLFLDWVLAPQHLLPALHELDDDKCVQSHASDDDATVLFCDGCEGKYNITRLDPPLAKVPKGDWYCPRCVSGRWWGLLDPRIGKRVRKGSNDDSLVAAGSFASVESCFFRYGEGEGSTPSLMYTMKVEGSTECWPLQEVDRALKRAGIEVPAVLCVEALAECPGYGAGVDIGLYKDLVPIPLNPNVSDSAAQVALSSSVFTDTLAASGTLLVTDPKEMTSTEWMRILVLLTMKCASSEMVQGVISKMEAEAAESMVLPLEQSAKVNDIRQILPEIFEAEEPSSMNGTLRTESDDARLLAIDEDDRMDTAAAVSESNFKLSTVAMASAVEVVDDMEVDQPPGEGDACVEPLKAILVETTASPQHGFLEAIAAKKKRRKAMEDSLAAYSIKAQLKTATASFQEDNISQVVDSSLSSSVPGLDLASVRCRRIQCSLCGLTDLALGAPLVRVPNEQEWSELIPHVARNRRVTLIAQMPHAMEDGHGRQHGCLKSVLAVKIRVDGDLFSVPDPDLASVEDGGMVEFVPRAETGFYHELLCLDDSGLPFITGSLSSHECCAFAAHSGRKDLMIQRHKEKLADSVEKQAAMKCGRTLELGCDNSGRSYWQFRGDANSLFVCMRMDDTGLWRRFGDPESIASVMVALRKDKILQELQVAFPVATALVKSGKWVDALLKRRFPNAFSFLAADKVVDDADVQNEKSVAGDCGTSSHSIGERVLVESKAGDMLWNASVTDVKLQSHSSREASLGAIQVHYEGWDNRYTEWVDPSRVIALDTTSLRRQSNIFDQRASSNRLPPLLTVLVAKSYFASRDRARGTLPLPDFARIAQTNKSGSMNAVTFAAAKAAVLAVEAALPVGSIDVTETGPWRSEYASKWRHLVQQSDGPARLMACVILLEDTICVEWIKEDIGHLRSTLPARWKAIREASPSSLAMRIMLLDRSIMYGTIDRRRFRSRKKKQ